MAATEAVAAAAAAGAGGGQIHHQQQQQQHVRILYTTLVGPAGPALPARSIPLTFFDVKWLHLPPVERLLLYRLSPDADVPAILSALRTSLSQALRAFYPMAGHVVVVKKQQGRPRHELLYRPGDAVPFTTAEYDDLLDDPAAAPAVKVATLAPLVPLLPKGRAVLAVQATLLPNKGLLALGVTVHHSTCDGAASTHFLHTWAAWASAAAAGAAAAAPPPPVIDRDLIPDPRGLYDIYLDGMPPMVSRDDLQFVLGKHQDPDEDKVLATFTLPHHLLQSIKGAVAGEAARRGMLTPPPRCSSILATYAFIWSCYCQSQSQYQATTSYFLFSVDQRSRLKPPVPDKYFGNCCCPAIARAPRHELAAGGIGGLFAACAALAAALEEELAALEEKEERWDTCVARVKEAVATGAMLSVAGSPRFHVYDLDFGFGPPAKVDMVSVAKTGAISVADAPPPHRGGGVQVGISLPTHDMARFRQTFADGIAGLEPPSFH